MNSTVKWLKSLFSMKPSEADAMRAYAQSLKQGTARLEPCHRDDIPFEVAEALVEKVKAEVERMHPGAKFKLKFAGDSDDSGAADEFGRRFVAPRMERMVDGQCGECGCECPGWPGYPPKAGWSMPDGWKVVTDIKNRPNWIECPECGDEDED